MTWGFYGRADELRAITQIVQRQRWFFAKMTGRRRIGKTTLIQRAIQATGDRPVFYVQVPDSGPVGVLSAVADAFESFGVPPDQFSGPHDLGELARSIGSLARAGYLVVLDEFQYFNRAHLRPFCSFLQAEVDALSADADRVPGGLIVLGSVHTEMMALLEDRSAPLYNRTTDELTLTHLDVASLKALLQEHADASPERLLFLWTLFEGVPKFYRDCYEQGVLAADRPTLLRRIFFESSSPLRTEAENWFLKELRGQYDVEGMAFEKLVGLLYEERSRKAVGDFPLTERINGYWDRGDTEIDLVALNETDSVLRLGSCKRSAQSLMRDVPTFEGHIERFLDQFPHYRKWRVERVCLAPRIPDEVRQVLAGHGYLVQDLSDLTADL